MTVHWCRVSVTFLFGVALILVLGVGATRSTAVAQALFGSIPEEIGEQSDGTVALARGALYKPRSVTQGMVDWLSA